MVVAHRGADLGVGRESSAGRLHLDAGRLEREFGWEEELAMVFTACVRSVGRASEDVVPAITNGTKCSESARSPSD